MAPVEDLEFLLGKLDEMKELGKLLGVEGHLHKFRSDVESARVNWATDVDYESLKRLGAMNERADELLEKIWCWHERHGSGGTSSSSVIAYSELSGYIFGLRRLLQQFGSAVESARVAWATELDYKYLVQFREIHSRVDGLLEKISHWHKGQRDASSSSSSSVQTLSPVVGADVKPRRRRRRRATDLDDKCLGQLGAIRGRVDALMEKISRWHKGRRSASSSLLTYSKLAGHILVVQRQLQEFGIALEPERAAQAIDLDDKSLLQLGIIKARVDDLLETIRYWHERHRNSGTSSSSFSWSSVVKVAKEVTRFCNKVKFRRGIASDLKRLMIEYQQPTTQPETTDVTQMHDLAVRDEDVEKIIARIDRLQRRRPVLNDHKLHIIPIVGIPGIGKTAVARKVFDTEVLDRFDERIWVHVSPRFDHKTVLRRMAKALPGTSSSFENDEDSIIHFLQENLKDKRYLLVLDDVWNEDFTKWNALKKQLLDISGARGTVIVTTSRYRVAETMMMKAADADPPHELQGLSEADRLQLFHHLLQEQQLPLPQGQDEELKIRKMIQENIRYGLPLEVLNLSKSFMVEQNYSHEFISGRIEKYYNSVSRRYEHLPLYLKYCFRFCSLFPRDHSYDLEELGEIWLALRYANYPESKDYHAQLWTSFFLHDSADEATYKMHYSTKELSHPELARYGELWKHCFFHSHEHSTEEKVTYKMHYSMHQFAKHRLKGASFQTMAAGDMVQPPDNPLEWLHLSLLVDPETSALPRALSSLKNLKTLILLRQPQMLLSDSKCKISRIAPELFASMKHLCVLDLQCTMIKKLPRTMRNLRNLRYLNLSETTIKTVPRFIGKLQSLMFLKLVNCKYLRRIHHAVAGLVNLQKLDIAGCVCLVRVPNMMDNMKQLRCMNIKDCLSMIQMPYGLGQCTNLHTLPRYIVGEDDGHTISELKNLTALEGELRVENLQLVATGKDAATAELWNKTMLKSLTLQWKNVGEENVTGAVQEVLEKLQPNKNLIKLEIISYMGDQFPKWMIETPPYLASLEEIKLCNLKKCKELPPLGVLPLLRVAEISGMDAITKVDGAFYGADGTFRSLRRLTFSQMLELEKWSDVDRRNMFPRLTNLTFIHCPKMVALDMELPSVTELTMWMNNNENLYNSKCGLKGLTRSLKKLSICLCEELSESSECEALQELRSLEEMEISGCQELTRIPMGIRRLSSMKSLTIVRCNKMTAPPEWSNGELSSLRSLSVNGRSLLPDDPPET